MTAYVLDTWRIVRARMVRVELRGPGTLVPTCGGTHDILRYRADPTHEGVFVSPTEAVDRHESLQERVLHDIVKRNVGPEFFSQPSPYQGLNPALVPVHELVEGSTLASLGPFDKLSRVL